MSSTAPQLPEEGGAAEIPLEFQDNFLLIDLCGQHDRNLAQIEAHYEVQILRRGNVLTVVGPAADARAAADTLTSLYQRLEAGREIDPDQITREMDRDISADYTTKDGEGRFARSQDNPVEIKTRKKIIEPRTAAQKAYVQNLFDKEMNFGIGPAGTGKTYLAVAVGVNMFLNGAVDRIILSRPAVEAGERLGFLPGDMKEKVDPYMQPLYDALNDFIPGKQLAKLFEDKQIEIAPLAFMRGRTLSRAFVVLDEAQNATTMQMKMFLTRLGEGSRMVITGDRTQIDLPRGVPSGLKDAERILKPIDSIGFSYFTAKDVVRHPLVARIIEAYEADLAQGT